MKRQDYNPEIVAQLIYNYQTLKMPLIKCGKEFGISKAVVKRILQENNIHIRTNGEVHRKYNANDSFFSTENADMAYILGFIAADGSISKNDNRIKIGLSTRDKNQLELIKSLMNINYPIKDYINSKNYEVSELIWTCQQHKNDLAKYGIVPNKTYSLIFPKQLNKQYWRDFIRGYFDGDGCITGQKPEWKICAYRKEILETINDFFFENGIKKVEISKRKNENLYDIRYASLISLHKIYDLLYYSDDIPYLKRKKEKFDSYKMI